MTVLAIALELAARGLSVIPVPRAGVLGRKGQVLDGKTRDDPWGEFQRRRATGEELGVWFADPIVNLAVVTGAVSGVVVVDADSPEALAWIRRRLPYTPWQTQTAK